uniref:G-protein coupled receptors family 1 profile domain-containing protein n=1 Tax=Electrophorus electricus TaxID=8005 RepID=A0AAY5ETR8_ELEEL
MWNVSLDDLLNPCARREAYLEKYMGPLGVLGNVLTCTIIARYWVMRTPTNYYLFSLALSDLLVLLLGLPLELYELWSNYPFLLGAGGCYFKTYLFETVCLASMLNVTFLSAEHYLAVVHPVRARHVITWSRAKRLILVLWTMALLCTLPNTSLRSVQVLPLRFGQSFPDSAVCGLVQPAWIYNLLVQLTALLFFLLPMLVISMLYLLQAHTNAWHGQSTAARNRQQRTCHRQVTRMLFVLVIIFRVCWAPFHIDRVMWSYIDIWTDEHHRIFKFVHLLSGIFFYLSSVVNPILYNLMSSRLQTTVKEPERTKSKELIAYYIAFSLCIH